MIDPNPHDQDRLAELLARYAEARVSGDTPEEPPGNLDPQLAHQLREATECLDLLHEVWPQPPGQERSQQAPASRDAARVPLPEHIGRFVILDELGRGGGGVVYLASDPELGREVALKVPRPEVLADPDLRTRFVREGQAAARLEHPGLVAVFEAGTDGLLCYLVSAYCPGPNVRTWLQQRIQSFQPVPVRQAAGIIADLAEAVAYMHAQGVLHRDIKPSNVLLQPDPTHPENPGIPRLTDFGHARFQDDEQRLTQSNVLVGTPLYMAPEQVNTRLAPVGPWTDIHALGLMLYELLTGDVPFRGKTSAETFHRTLHEAPVSPSKHRLQVHVDLETITLACLDKAPQRRYPTATDLATDLRSFLAGEPIQRRPVSTFERIQRWCLKNPLTVFLVSSVVIALLCLVVTGFWLHTTQRERDLERKARKVAEERSRIAEELADTEKAHGLLDRIRLRNENRPLGWRWQSLKDLHTIARLKTKLRDSVAVRTEVATCLAGVDVRKKSFLLKNFGVGALAFSPDHQYLVVAQYKQYERGKPGLVRLIHLASRKERHLHFPIRPYTRYGPEDGDGSRSVCFSPDGQYMVLGSHSGFLYWWDLSRDSSSPMCWQDAKGGEVHRVWFSPDGRCLFSYSALGWIKRWEGPRWKHPVSPPLERGESREGGASKVLFGRCGTFEALPSRRPPVSPPAAFRAAGWGCSPGWSPDGEYIACSTGTSVVFLYGKTLHPNPNRTHRLREVNSCCYSPDGQFLAVGGRTGIKIIGMGPHDGILRTAEGLGSLGRDVNWERLQFNRDGSLLMASGGLRRVVGLWDVASGKLLAKLLAGDSGPLVTAFHPTKDAVVVGCNSQVVLSEIGGLKQQDILAHYCLPLRTFTFSADGSKLFCLTDRIKHHPLLRGTVTIWDLASGHRSDVLPIWLHNSDHHTFAPLAHHPHKEVFAYAGGKERIEVRGLAQGQTLKPLLAKDPQTLRFSPTGQRLWGITEHKHVQSWDWATGKVMSRWTTELPIPTGQSLAVGRNWVLVSDLEDIPHLLRASDGQLHCHWPVLKRFLSSVALHPNEKLAACADRGGLVRVVHVPEGSTVVELHEHADRVDALAFSPGGELLATGSHDHRVHLYLWKDGTYQHLLRFPSFSGPVKQLRFHPDGRLLGILVEGEHAVRIWHLEALRRHLNRMDLGDPHWPAPAEPVLQRADPQLKKAYYDARLAMKRGIRLSQNGDRRLGRLWLVRALELVGGGDKPLQRTLRLYLTQPPRHLTAWWPEFPDPILSIASHPWDRNLLVTGHDQKHGACLWNKWRRGWHIQMSLHKDLVPFVANTADGDTIVTGSRDATVRFWKLGTNKPLEPLIRTRGPIVAMAVQPKNSKMLLTVSDDPRPYAHVGKPEARHVERGVSRGEPASPIEQGPPVGAAGASVRVLAGQRSHVVQCWDVRTRKPLLPDLHLHAPITSVSFSWDGQWFLVTCADNSSQIYHAATRKPSQPPRRLPTGVICCTLHPNGSLLATGSKKGTVQLWDTRTWQPVRARLEHAVAINQVLFTPNGELLATLARKDGTVRFWHVPTGEPFGEPFLHPREVTYLDINPDGSQILSTLDEGGCVRSSGYWPVPLESVEHIKAQVQVDSGLELMPDGRTRPLDAKTVLFLRNQLRKWKKVSE